MNIRANFPTLEDMHEAHAVKQYAILATFDDNCYNSDFLEQEYGEIVRNLISGCIERGKLDRKELQNSLRDIFDKTSLSSEECVQVAVGVLKERFSAAALRGTGLDGMDPSLRLPATAASPVAASSLTLPDVAPELYENRKRPESPVQYYDRVWRRYADAGVLYQDQLRKLDPKLIPAVHTHCSKRGLDAKEHLPPPRQERTWQLALQGDQLAQLRIKQAKWNRDSRQRHHESHPK